MPLKQAPARDSGEGGTAQHPPAGVPRPFIPGHRGHLVLATYAVVVTSLIIVIAMASGSFTSACVFAALFTAAATILVLPTIMALVCAAEAVEVRWLCSRHEGFRRWWTEAGCEPPVRSPEAGDRPALRVDYWRTLAPEALRCEVARLLEDSGCRVERVPTVDEAGVDIVASRGSRRAVVRCWPDLARCGPAVARELLAARVDFEADEAMVVTPGGSTPKLLEYRRRRGFMIVDADDLAAAEAAGGLDPFPS